MRTIFQAIVFRYARGEHVNEHELRDNLEQVCVEAEGLSEAVRNGVTRQAVTSAIKMCRAMLDAKAKGGA